MKIWPILVCFTVEVEGLPVIVAEMQGQPYAVVRIFKSLLLSAPPLRHRAREDGL